ncbi:hypothetical protein HFO29_32525 [Rhizobium laguerreae]|uniref:hypothetical protein n=1 Tax=Rhizobium laguerreae TaxID=1076926 RepID=UPI0003627063|nr:hypothetical protein [Rhizobium laguerreae]KAF5886185.1 hypothetical protein FY112_08080 [Rhizobium sp. PEPV16]MBY3122581.1 hypothetical protein [Rhizobium laguerreae]
MLQFQHFWIALLPKFDPCIAFWAGQVNEDDALLIDCNRSTLVFSVSSIRRSLVASFS